MDEPRIKVSRERLDEMLVRTGLHIPHLTPVIKVVLDFSVKLLIVPQTSKPMRDALDIAERPSIAVAIAIAIVVADDTVGPGHFDKMSLDRLIGMADGATVEATRQ